MDSKGDYGGALDMYSKKSGRISTLLLHIAISKGVRVGDVGKLKIEEQTLGKEHPVHCNNKQKH